MTPKWIKNGVKNDMFLDRQNEGGMRNLGEEKSSGKK